jgi:DNA repair exonuclease SbcCD ATPase subunit
MRIKEISIIHYGPLPRIGPISLHDFNLFFGRNEDGKTLTIDALVKLLLGPNARDFQRIDRVGENPEGYIIIEDDNDGEVKLPEKGDITQVVDVTPVECRNVFIIRNSDLSIAHESEFYTHVTDRLTGLRTREILDIGEHLREIGKITPSGEFRDIKDEKLKTRIENARSLVDEIHRLTRDMKGKKFDALESEFVGYTEKMEGITGKMEILEDARKREKYEITKKALDTLKDSRKRYRELGIYNEGDEQFWRLSERDIKTLTEGRKRLLQELGTYARWLQATTEEFHKIETEFRVLDERKRTVDGEMRPALKTYEIRSGELAQREERRRFVTPIGIISAILIGMSLLGVTFRPWWPFYALAALSSGFALLSAIMKFQCTRERAWLAGLFERTRLALSKFALDGQSIEEILSKIQIFDEEYRTKYEELQRMKSRREHLEERVNELKDKTISEINTRLREAQKKIDEMRIKSNTGSLEEYTERLNWKRNLERSIGTQESVLRSHFGQRSESVGENISVWDREIKSLKRYKDKAKDVTYSEHGASALDQEKRDIEEKLEEIDEEMRFLHLEMGEVERRGNEILASEGEYFHCKTSVDLHAVIHKLREYINDHEVRRSDVLEVMRIFEEMAEEEKQKVSELFGKGSSISQYFHQITGGLYEEVVFDQATGGVAVKRRDGLTLGAEKLSGGAYDQLYLAVRLALGERLLKGNRGFFIMDDPFVKADPERLQRQIETLKKISLAGWQIIYFSAKGEINDALKEHIDRGEVTSIEVEAMSP